MSVFFTKTIFKITTWGESHGDDVDQFINSCPVGLELKTLDIQKLLNGQECGGLTAATSRYDFEAAETISRKFQGKTLGTPISSLIRNRGQRSGDYSYIEKLYRLSHAA